MLAQLAVMLGNALGIKKRPEGAAKEPPDPNALTITDYAPHLTDSVFHTPEVEWTEADHIKLRASIIKGLMSNGIQAQPSNP